jgi:hypothetical protein
MALEAKKEKGPLAPFLFIEKLLSDLFFQKL